MFGPQPHSLYLSCMSQRNGGSEHLSTSHASSHPVPAAALQVSTPASRLHWLGGSPGAVGCLCKHSVATLF